MNENIKVSVIMPVYNAAQFLDASIGDLLAQTCEDFELICVDDGSTDGSSDMLDRFAASEVRMTVVHQSNQGGGAARNVGLRMARGKYLLSLDADDRFEPELLDRVYAQAEASGCDILVYGADIFDHTSGERHGAPWLIKGASDIIQGNPFQVVNTTVWNKLFRRDFIEEQGIYFQTNRIVDTMSFVGIALLAARKITVLREILLHYRTNNSSSILANSDKYPLEIYFALKEIYSEIKKRDLGREKRSYYYGFAVENIRQRLFRLKSGDGFHELYTCLHDGGLDEIGLIEGDSLCESYIDDSLIRDIRTKTSEQYLYDRQREMVSRGILTVTTFGMSDGLLQQCKDKKVWLHGGGMVGRSLFLQLLNHRVTMVGWSDKSASGKEYPVTSVDTMLDTDYEVVILAVEAEGTAQQMREELISMNVSPTKIIWEKPIRI